MTTRKLGAIQKLFGSKKLSIDDDDADEALDDANAIMQEFKRCSSSRRHTVDVETFRGEMTDEALMAAASAKYSTNHAGLMLGGQRESASFENCLAGNQRPVARTPTDKESRKPPVARKSSAGPYLRTESAVEAGSSSGVDRHRRSGVDVTAVARKTNHQKGSRATGKSIPPKAARLLLGPTHPLVRTGGSFKRRSIRKDRKSVAKVDTTKPLVFPTTPETILEYHKARPFLDENEEWLLVELNEYECLVDSLAIIKIIAKHSKFFEVEPDELWEEFFEFVDDVPSYDEVINFDVWQEFRDKRYTC